MPDRSIISPTLLPDPSETQEEIAKRAETRIAYIKLAPEDKYVDVDTVLDSRGPFTDEAFQGGKEVSAVRGTNEAVCTNSPALVIGETVPEKRM